MCPRCGYNTNDKTKISLHFYKRKTTCPGTVNPNLELTEEIKQHVLQHRLYVVPVAELHKPTINQTINNYYQLNKIVKGMDTIDKINMINTYNNDELLDFEEGIENRFLNICRSLDNNELARYQLTMHNFKDIIEEVTAPKNSKHFNVVYHDATGKLKFFKQAEWMSLSLEEGIKMVIEYLRDYYLNNYECYIIRKYKDTETDLRMKHTFYERLKDYYKFLACFELEAYALVADDDDIGEPGASTEFGGLFEKVRDNMLMKECREISKAILTMAVNNNKNSISELNKKMMEIMHMDEEFKEIVMDKLAKGL
jgi:hypothetical protein